MYEIAIDLTPGLSLFRLSKAFSHLCGCFQFQKRCSSHVWAWRDKTHKPGKGKKKNTKTGNILVNWWDKEDDAKNYNPGEAKIRKYMRPIAYWSRVNSAAERKWATIQLELSAIVMALRNFQPYIYGMKVIVHSDHRPLIYLMTRKGTHPNLARWAVELMQMIYTSSM